MLTSLASVGKRSFILILFIALPANAVDIVNKINGGANIVYADFSIAGPVVPLEILRTYNSITAVNEANGWNGAMGWGWTTPFETELTVTPERHVLLRDGQTGNTIQFKPEKDDPKVEIEFMEKLKRAFFEKKTGRKVSDEDLAKLVLPERIQTKLVDPQYREELASRYGLRGVIPRGKILISTEYGYQTLQMRDNQWIRDRDGIVQIFDSAGRIIRQKDKNGYYFDYRYSKGQKLQLSEIAAQDNTITLRFKWRGDHLVDIVDNRNRHATYSYDGAGNLIRTVSSSGQIYSYKYESRKFPHLLTKIEYVSESTPSQKVFRELRYDDNGLAIFHRDKDGTETDYVYGKQPNDPENNFWTKTVERIGGRTEEEYDEYFIKVRSDGGKYLAKQIVKAKGVTTETEFTSFGKPSKVTKNGETLSFRYYSDGLLAERSSARESFKLEYDSRWKKLSKVNQNGFISDYTYDARGNLVTASNNRNEKLSLKYDKYGRISEMDDPSGQQIMFKYGDQGKPVLITDKTVGTLKIEYDSAGRITKTEAGVIGSKGRHPTQLKSTDVVRRVMQGFQHLLDIIRPAGLNLLNT